MAEKILTQPVPNLRSPMVSVVVNVNGRKLEGKGFLLSPWNSFFQQFVQTAPQPIDVITDPSLPYEYTPGANGSIVISGGTGPSSAIIRNNTEISVAGSRIIRMRIGDTFKITAYTGNIEIRFLPD